MQFLFSDTFNENKALRNVIFKMFMHVANVWTTWNRCDYNNNEEILRKRDTYSVRDYIEYTVWDARQIRKDAKTIQMNVTRLIIAKIIMR